MTQIERTDANAWQEPRCPSCGESPMFRSQVHSCCVVAQRVTEPDEALVERVARSLMCLHWGPHHWDSTPQHRDHWLDLARAALAALRDLS